MRFRIIGLSFFLWACGAVPPEDLPNGENVQVFSGAKLWDGLSDDVRSGLVVVVRDGRIERIVSEDDPRIPSAAETVDLKGKYLLPGLINSHGHVGFADGMESGPEVYNRDNVRRQLKLYADYGVTSVLSLGSSDSDLFGGREERTSVTTGRARFYSSGPVLEPSDIDSARAQVREAAARRVDYVKIRVDDNLGTIEKMPADVFGAVIDEAHRQGLKVAAHVFYLEDAKELIRAGVDFLAHSVRDQDVDQEFIGLLEQADICLCPTLVREVSTFVYESRPDFFDDPFFLERADAAVLERLTAPERQDRIRNSRAAQRYKEALKVAQRNLKALSDAGLQIAFGTDSGPPGRFQGYFEHLELDLMAEAGLSPRQIFESATSQAADCLGWDSDVGTLQEGRWADFTVFRDNPLENVTHSRSLDSVWMAGRRIR